MRIQCVDSTAPPRYIESVIESVIRTSEKGWVGVLAKAYKSRGRVLLIDDANTGIDPNRDSLVAMGIKAHLAIEEWIAAGVSIGISAAGSVMVVLAFIDPEPTSKLGLLVGGGAVCVLAGGLTAIRILTRLRPPNISAGAGGIRISWDEKIAGGSASSRQGDRNE
jgi:pimeloyl-ACP methyl ester carboxylesterase